MVQHQFHSCQSFTRKNIHPPYCIFSPWILTLAPYSPQNKSPPSNRCGITNTSPTRTNQIQIQANLTFTLLLTMKMTAAKAVETSVTSTNSLSQDYINLDDQLPQTCHNTSSLIKTHPGQQDQPAPCNRFTKLIMANRTSSLHLIGPLFWNRPKRTHLLSNNKSISQS